MPLSRRDFLKLTGLVASSAALASCRPLYELAAGNRNPPPGDWPPLSPADFRALNRLTFGARPSERIRVAEIGIQAWVEEQLTPDSIDDFAGCATSRRSP